jgi:hypothetical protein
MRIFVIIFFILLWLFFSYKYLVLDYSLLSNHFNSTIFETIFYWWIAFFFFLLWRYFPYSEELIEDNIEKRSFIIEDDLNVSEDNFWINTKDDLKIIEWIGPKVESVLNNSWILTFNDLKNSTFEELTDILNKAGDNFRIINPKTWPYQAELAAKKDWDKLREYQDFLIWGVEYK